MSGIFLFLLLLSAGSGEMLLNNTIYLTSGESFALYQGYVLSVKSVSMDDSVWLQLTLNNSMVESEVVKINDYFIHNKSNRTILSVKVNNVYSGSAGQKLVSMSVRQFTDPELPVPAITVSFPRNNRSNGNITHPILIHAPKETVIWVMGTLFVLVLFYILHKLW